MKVKKAKPKRAKRWSHEFSPFESWGSICKRMYLMVPVGLLRDGFRVTITPLTGGRTR